MPTPRGWKKILQQVLNRFAAEVVVAVAPMAQVRATKRDELDRFARLADRRRDGCARKSVIVLLRNWRSTT
ncbi:hypothetical protein [Mycobacterium kiyosense]|uniref:hypothetical protein n=1 Tax=Mycobacterium kiyosense TaxID=2871094 RepID=UPI001F244D54|nr:hypothetical protein [Mycobacterium kiyosense]